MSINIRQARVDDAPRIADIHVRAWHAAYPGMVPDALLVKITVPDKEASWRRVLLKGGTCVLIVEDDAVIVGWASLGSSRDADADDRIGELYGMYIDPNLWRTGIGRELWAACEAELIKTFSVATLWVLEANSRARRFYEHCGFVEESEMVDRPDWLGVNRVRYRLEMKGAS